MAAQPVSGRACDFAPKRNSDSYLATENIRRETSPQEAEEAEKGMEEMSEVYREKGEKLYLPDEDSTTI